MAEHVFVGVDIGGTHLRVIAQSGAGRSKATEVAVPQSGDAVASAIIRESTRLAQGQPVAALGIGLPGQTAPDVPTWIPNLPFLDGYPLAHAVTEGLAAPSTLVNDATATLLAEAKEGAAQGSPTCLLVAFGTGIGGAMRVGGVPVFGRSGCAGSFGWLPLGDDAPDGSHGPWERTSSGARLAELSRPWGSIGALLEAGRSGAPTALRVIEDFGTVIGRGLAALASVFDPDLIIVAGGLTRAFDLMEAAVDKARLAHASPAGRHVPVVLAALGPDAGVIGALHTAVDSATARSLECT